MIWVTLYLDNKEALICHPLEIAAKNGCLNSYKYIAKKTQEYNPRLINGTTPFHLAADCGQFQICKFLIQNNLDKNPANDYGITPLHSAAEKGHFKICKLFIETLKSRSIKHEDVRSFLCFNGLKIFAIPLHKCDKKLFNWLTNCKHKPFFSNLYKI